MGRKLESQVSLIRLAENLAKVRMNRLVIVDNQYSIVSGVQHDGGP